MINIRFQIDCFKNDGVMLNELKQLWSPLGLGLGAEEARGRASFDGHHNLEVSFKF